MPGVAGKSDNPAVAARIRPWMALSPSFFSCLRAFGFHVTVFMG
jgi:hypothetical protein